EAAIDAEVPAGSDPRRSPALAAWPPGPKIQRSPSVAPSASSRRSSSLALEFADVWAELDDGSGSRDVLRGIDLALESGERVALGGGGGDGGPRGGWADARARRPRRADAGDGPCAQGGAREVGRRAGGRGRERRHRHSRRRVRIGVRRAGRAAR